MKKNYKEYLVISVCPICNEVHEIGVNEADYWDWQDGKCAQDAFPYLSADEREMLISGVCPDCWDRMFPPEEEEEEEDYKLEEFDYDFRDEIGFNPYMGCYDWDC